jgi:hypothetical protein
MKVFAKMTRERWRDLLLLFHKSSNLISFQTGLCHYSGFKVRHSGVTIIVSERVCSRVTLEIGLLVEILGGLTVRVRFRSIPVTVLDLFAPMPR